MLLTFHMCWTIRRAEDICIWLMSAISASPVSCLFFFLGTRIYTIAIHNACNRRRHQATRN